VVSRAWRKVKVDWQAWCTRSLADEDIVRLILDGTVIRTRIDRKATNISVLAAIGVRRVMLRSHCVIIRRNHYETSFTRRHHDDARNPSAYTAIHRLAAVCKANDEKRKL
jgi:hypothetical protein